MATNHLLDDRREIDPSATTLVLGSSPTTAKLRGRGHRRALCHSARALALALVGLGGVTLAGCASTQGWSVTEARTCAPRAPARVCSIAEPDYGHVLTVGDAAMLPGECAALGDEGRGGLVRVSTRDPRGQGRKRWLRAPRSRATLLELDQDGRAKVVDRPRCDASPY
jgi:hypothetical protein